jgi:RHS repeat-associated protein
LCLSSKSPVSHILLSYTRYDALGRVVEVGEKTDPATGTGLRFKQIFGAMVSGTYNPTVISETKLISWIENNDGERREVTKSYYDEPLITQVPVTFDPHTQRKRITHVTYEELYDDNDQTYDHASHFVYDIHGNVKTLVQDNRKMAVEFASLANQRFKRMDYTYDLVSGNVHRMSVTSVDTSGILQPADQWHHAYRYDADNRIVEVFTSRHTPLLNGGWSNAMLENELTENPDWHKDAHYVYYDHGPLARVELGKDQLQGLDYVYNLQGWLKGVNATSLTNTLDPGKDGVTTGSNPVNGNFAKDVFAFSLHYHQGDYTPIGATAPAATINSGSHAAANSSDLYNGNIRFMQTTLTNPTTREAMPMLNAYRYDQLNRLAQSRSYENGYSANEWNPTSYANNYFNAFTFDAMGNILTQKRHKRDGTQIEDMTYRYKYDVNNKLLRNRLYHVNDAIAAHVDDTDIDDMGTFVSNPLLIETANNYSYDEEGRLIKDTQEGIERITWRVDGKVKSIERPLNSGKKNVSFDYNAFGNRIAKHVFDDDWMLEKSTYYILDAQGNQLSMYEHVVDENEATVNYTLSERNIYGSSRLGKNNQRVDVFATHTENSSNTVLGETFYELSNQLGNVLTVINDIKIPLSDDNQTVSGYDAGIVSISDYSPFGVQLDGRTVSASSYRYGYQNSEKDDEVKGSGNSYSTYFRQLDPRIGRWLSLDPRKSEMPWESPMVSMNNNPIGQNDVLGDKPTPKEAALIANHVYGGVKDSKLKGGWKPSERTIDGVDGDALAEGNEAGLKGRLYERTKRGVTEYVYAYAGTEDLLKDGVTDVAQVGGMSTQYNQAYQLSQDVSSAIGSNELTFVGHSLGGGLANLSALATNRASVTFNPAWLSTATLMKHGLLSKSDEKLTNYVVFGEILDASQRAIYTSQILLGQPSIIVPRGTTRYLFSGKTVFSGALGPIAQGYFSVMAHTMGEVINQIEDVEQYNRIWSSKTNNLIVDK